MLNKPSGFRNLIAHRLFDCKGVYAALLYRQYLIPIYETLSDILVGITKVVGFHR